MAAGVPVIVIGWTVAVGGLGARALGSVMVRALAQSGLRAELVRDAPGDRGLHVATGVAWPVALVLLIYV